jgi:orotidine 5'-phosphate decarboxylase subfamily 1/orotate phosphoribosyltransferase
MNFQQKQRLIGQLKGAGLVKIARPGEPFVLKSGLTSEIYVDLRTLGGTPKLHAMVCQGLVDILPKWIFEEEGGCDYVAGLPLGGVPLAALVSHLGELPLLLIRKQPKDHGTGRIVEAELSEMTDVILVDDVITTGSTVKETVERFNKSGAPIRVAGVLCVVNRCDGAPSVVPDTDIPLHSLLTLDELLSARHVREPFSRRALVAKNARAHELFQVMEEKKTNVCWSADVSTFGEVLRFFRAIAPHIAMIKLHFDALLGVVTHENFGELFQIARENKVLVMGDRKFADIGSTVKRQLTMHPAGSLMDECQMHCCTVHTISGEGPIHALEDASISSVIVAQMSNSDVAPDYAKPYAEAAAALARTNQKTVMGLVCQNRRDCDAGDGFVYMTPGVHLQHTSDGADQRYRDCFKAIATQGNDLVIVGRGIHLNPNPEQAAREYREAAWSAYTGCLSQ